MKKRIRNLIMILGDQLSLSISSLQVADPAKDLVLMMEVKAEATYVPHHPHKIILIFSAMRHFAELLVSKGYQVHYLELDSPDNRQNFTDNLEQSIATISPEKVIITEPGEYRVLDMIRKWQTNFSVPIEIREDDRFLCSISAFKKWANKRNQLRMEHFYQKMRKATGILMANGKPLKGRWNYDSENRKPPKKGMIFPKRPSFHQDEITQAVIKLVEKNFSSHFGNSDNFNFAVTRRGALIALNHFIDIHLASFGDYQDAMLDSEYYLHHSVLSPYLNIGLITPKEVIHRAEQALYERHYPINAVKGFIRQILGWREFIRGIYWLKMPSYGTLNTLSAKEPLPEFYWSGDTKMQCLKHAILQTKETATSHHIQRLMLTGNFALIIGVVPEAICEWYLAVYADAFEWVELPNTLGMSQFADGGIVASKPYACSGNYIHKMSNFCSNCHYDVKEKTTENACPFNYLYWDFLLKHEPILKKNPRMAFAYRYLDKLSCEQKSLFKNLADRFRKNL